jgi:hypothetical protein
MTENGHATTGKLDAQRAESSGQIPNLIEICSAGYSTKVVDTWTVRHCAHCL